MNEAEASGQTSLSTVDKGNYHYTLISFITFYWYNVYILYIFTVCTALQVVSQSASCRPVEGFIIHFHSVLIGLNDRPTTRSCREGRSCVGVV